MGADYEGFSPCCRRTDYVYDDELKVYKCQICGHWFKEPIQEEIYNDEE